MQAFRSLGNTKFIKVFLGILALSFVTWGIGDYITGGRGTAAITINGQAIDATVIQRRYQAQISQLQQQLGRALTDDLIGLLNVPQQAIQQTLQENLLLQTAAKLHLTASPMAVRERVLNNQAFWQDGAFDFPTYQAQLNRIGFTTDGYEAELSNAQKIQYLANLMVPPALPKAIQTTLIQQQQTALTLDVVTLSPVAIKRTPNQTELEAFFTENAAQYQTPEMRDIQFVILDQTDLQNADTLNEEAFKAYYEKHKQQYARPDQRLVKHIVLPDEGAANSVLTQAQSGVDFTELASTHSIDPFSASSGGELGWVSAQDLPEGVSNAVFKASLNTFIGPVESPLGWHVVTVTDKRAGVTPTFIEVRKKVEEDALLTYAEEQFFTLQDQLDDAVAAGSDATALSAQWNLPLQNLGTLDATAASAAAKVHDPLIIAQSFAVNTTGTERVEISDTQVAYVSISAITPPAAQTLVEVKSQVQEDWQKQQQNDALQQQASALLEEAQQQTLRQAAHALGHNVTTVTNLTRRQKDVPAWLQNETLSTLLRSPSGTILPQPIVFKDQRIVVQLTQRKLPKSVDLKTFSPQLLQSLSQELQHQWLTNNLQKADIKMHHNILRQIFGNNWQG